VWFIQEKHAVANNFPSQNTITSLKYGADLAMAMLAGMQLDLFTPLQHGPLSAVDLAMALGVDPERLRLLLFALVAAELLSEDDGYFANTSDAQRFLVKGTPEYLGYLHAIWSGQIGISANTADSLRVGRPQAAVDFSNAPAEELETYLTSMSSATVSTAKAMLERFDLSSARQIADVGGGSGALALTLAQSLPNLQATVIELPHVAQIAAKLVAESGASERVKVQPANVVNSPVDGQFDAAILLNFLQVLSPEAARKAVGHIAAALQPGGKVFIIGQILDNSRVAPPQAVAFNLIFINRFHVGEAYTENQYRRWLEEAGFENIQRADFLLTGSGVMWAQKRA
jgi:predicted O-methyltransferase YrrM